MKDLPRGWALTTLAALGNGKRPAVKAGPFGSALKKEFYSSSGYRVYGQEQVIADDFSVGDYFIDQARFDGLRSCEVRPGDVLVSLVGTFGKASVVPDGVHPGIINPRLIRLSLDPRLVDPWFLKRFLGSPAVQHRFEAVAHGGTMGVLNATTVGPLALSLPPLNEQRRIVAKLEALQARSRRAREAVDGVPPLLEKLRQSILAAAFRGDLTKDWRAKHKDVEPASKLLERIRVERRKKWEEAELAKMKAKGKVPTDDRWKASYKEPEPVDATGLPELPDGWCWATASEVCEQVVDCHNKTAPYVTSGVPLIRTTNVRNGHIDLTETRFVDEPTYAFWSRRCPPQPGDIIFTREAPMGEAGMVPTDTRLCMGQRMMLLRADGTLLRRGFLLFAVQAPYVTAYARHLSVGTGVQHLRVGDVEALPVPLAPVAEQIAIEDTIAAILARHSTIAGLCSSLHRTFATLDRATLAKAFGGELVPQDPDDEPAEVTLARVRGANGRMESRRSRRAPAPPYGTTRTE